MKPFHEVGEGMIGGDAGRVIGGEEQRRRQSQPPEQELKELKELKQQLSNV